MGSASEPPGAALGTPTFRGPGVFGEKEFWGQKCQLFEPQTFWRRFLAPSSAGSVPASPPSRPPTPALPGGPQTCRSPRGAERHQGTRSPSSSARAGRILAAMTPMPTNNETCTNTGRESFSFPRNGFSLHGADLVLAGLGPCRSALGVRRGQAAPGWCCRRGELPPREPDGARV